MDLLIDIDLLNMSLYEKLREKPMKSGCLRRQLFY